MTDIPWNDHDLLSALAIYGPMRSLTLQGTPLPQVIAAGLAREMHTLYGPVALLTPKGRAAYSEFDPVHLTGPDAVTDRAYHNDARFLLEREGYRVYSHQYKRHGHKSAVHERRYSDAIVYTTMQVPDEEYARLWEVHGAGYHMATHREVLGRPRLYATVANGGLRSQRFRRLVESYLRSVNTWKHPLIIAVPDLQRHEADLRYLDRMSWRSVDNMVRVIHLPLPELGASPRQSRS
ncbi:hypothetical protein [Deinococcus gobiensis]|uniref:hypothetical protein n=1 Tax=Deinococcus gobiensis TaxID=502394 RepID=UPI0005C16698|nr:hypothetical protein [Deinococcus gobiensis]